MTVGGAGDRRGGGVNMEEDRRMAQEHRDTEAGVTMLTDEEQFVRKVADQAVHEALKRAATEPWSPDAPWIMAFKEWALEHGVDDPSGAMLWANLHIATILHAVNNFSRQEEALSQRTRERDRLLDVLHRDRSGLAKALNDVVSEVRSRSGMAESRGSYEWDDDRYRDEFRQALDAIRTIADTALRASGNLAHAECCGRSAALIGASS